MRWMTQECTGKKIVYTTVSVLSNLLILDCSGILLHCMFIFPKKGVLTKEIYFILLYFTYLYSCIHVSCMPSYDNRQTLKSLWSRRRSCIFFLPTKYVQCDYRDDDVVHVHLKIFMNVTTDLKNMNIINMAHYLHHISFSWQRKDVMYTQVAWWMINRRRAVPFLLLLFAPISSSSVRLWNK